ncbi:hypothetical protein V8G54_005231 [Vigna mungo]|uniref:Uncharacterized protein n=1 Tax=Vigna mungo TaxID=3915 RepID=A0AAQ3SDW3_VIGMU
MFARILQPISNHVKTARDGDQPHLSHFKEVVSGLHKLPGTAAHGNQHGIERAIRGMCLGLHIPKETKSIIKLPSPTQSLNNRRIQARKWTVTILNEIVEQPKCFINGATF